MDGVPGYSQPHVEPGGTFTYDFIVPDAGIYWYHPHVMSAMQVGFGLYGAFLVEDPTEAETVGVDDSLVIQYTFTKVGGDGGLLEYSVEQDFLVLGAGERADVIITPRGVPGDELMLRSQLHDRGYGSTEMRTVQDLVAITIADQPEHVGGLLPEVTRAIEPFRAEGATEITLTLTIDQDPISLKFEYGINGVPYWKASPVLAELGETQIWTVENTTPLVASAPPARVPLHGARRGRRTRAAVRMEGHRGRSVQADAALAGAVRRGSARHVALPLPHPRPCGGRPVEHRPPGPAAEDVQAVRQSLTRTAAPAPYECAGPPMRGTAAPASCWCAGLQAGIRPCGTGRVLVRKGGI